MRGIAHSMLVVFASSGLAVSSEYRALGDGCCVPPEGTETSVTSFGVPSEESRCKDECTFDPGCLAYEFIRPDAAPINNATCRLFKTSILKTETKEGSSCSCKLKAAPTENSPEYRMIGAGHCVGGRNETIAALKTARVDSTNECLAHCSFTPNCVGVEYSTISPEELHRQNCIMVGTPVIASQGSGSVTCFTRTVSTSRHKSIRSQTIRASTDAPEDVESRRRRVWAEHTTVKATAVHTSGVTATAQTPVVLASHQRSRRDEEDSSGEGTSDHRHKSRLCSPTINAFIKSDLEGNGGEGPGSGSYLVAGPPEEGWLIFGKNTGWWEEFEIRKCKRGAEHFILIRSRAHNRFLTVDDAGVISLQLPHDGTDQEFLIEEYEPETGFAAIATKNDLYFTYSPNGGLLATKRYWAGKFLFQTVPETTAEEEETKLQAEAASQ